MSAPAAQTHAVPKDEADPRSEPGAYRRYAEGVRREHRAVPRVLYVRGRRAFLAQMLARPAIFATPHFAARYERAARENLRAELARLDEE